jgi:hypothetical protein
MGAVSGKLFWGLSAALSFLLFLVSLVFALPVVFAPGGNGWGLSATLEAAGRPKEGPALAV